MTMLDSRCALVTGTSSGIGLAVAQRLLADGWQVVGLDALPAVLEHAFFVGQQVDLTDAAATSALIQALLARTTPAAFVHAAGLLRVGRIGTLQADEGELMWRVHVAAATQLANAVLPAMQRARAGRVVLLSSRVSRGVAGRSQYAATKAAVATLARSWASEVIADGVTVNVIAPAATDTPMLTASSRQNTPPKLPPLGRLIRPDEIAALTAFLLSPEAAAITGQEIAVCGGSSLPV